MAEPKEVTAARAVIRRHEEKTDKLREAAEKQLSLGQMNAREAIYRGDFNDALAAVKKLEAEFRTRLIKQ